MRHNLGRESSLPLFLGLLVHNMTQKRELVDCLYHHGLSVSYDRVMKVSTDEANRVIDIYKHEGLVCPTTLRKDLFTTCTLDNIDHNPSSTSAKGSFHGTSLSVTQHPTQESSGVKRTFDLPITDQPKRAVIQPLPDDYTSVPPEAFPSQSPAPRIYNGRVILGG